MTTGCGVDPGPINATLEILQQVTDRRWLLADSALGFLGLSREPFEGRLRGDR